MDKWHHSEFPSHLFYGGSRHPCVMEAMCALVPARAQLLCAYFAEGAA